jgi:ATP adenylyltransferase
MEQLWAPWRMAYIGGEPEPGCLFCRVRQAPPEDDPQNLVIDRPPGAIVILNKFPYQNGHLLIAPTTHSGDLTELSDGQAAELMAAVQGAVNLLRRVLGPEGFNVGCNMGGAAGAGIPDHVHFHVVPRWNGDNNYMAVLAETRVINEHLDATAAKLRAAISTH